MTFTYDQLWERHDVLERECRRLQEEAAYDSRILEEIQAALIEHGAAVREHTSLSDDVHAALAQGALGERSVEDLNRVAGVLHELLPDTFWSPAQCTADDIITALREHVDRWGNSLHMTADAVLFAYTGVDLSCLLVLRSPDSDAYPGYLALPGGYLERNETAEQAARRELAEETGISLPERDWLPVGVYDAPNRDPRGRVASVAFVDALDEPPDATAGDDAAEARWVPVAALDDVDLAFDHMKIIIDAYDVITGTR